MTWTVDASGTQSATIGSETILDSPATNATYVFSADTVNMVNGDLLELRCYDMVDGANYRQMWKGTYANIQINNDKASPPLAVTTQSQYSLRQAGGTFSVTMSSSTYAGSSLPYGTVMQGITSGKTATLLTLGSVTLTTAATTVVMNMISTSALTLNEYVFPYYGS